MAVTGEINTVIAMDATLRVAMRWLWDVVKRATVSVFDVLSADAGLRPALVVYSETARRLDPDLLPELKYDVIYAVNVHHALELATEALTDIPGSKRTCRIVPKRLSASISA